MIISLRDLVTSPEGRIYFNYTIDLSGVEVNFEHPFSEPVSVSGQVSDDAGMVHLTALVEVTVHTHCARCNRPIVYDKEVEVDFALVLALAGDEEKDDVIVVGSEDVELDDIVVPELILDMEMTVLCEEDCKGLCSQCGKNLNEGPCSCDTRQIDPRLEALRELLPRE